MTLGNALDTEKYLKDKWKLEDKVDQGIKDTIQWY